MRNCRQSTTAIYEKKKSGSYILISVIFSSPKVTRSFSKQSATPLHCTQKEYLAFETSS